ncbi:glycerate kinase [Anaerobacillus alkalilacustris]|uniref:Glycerate kinase n=1 Tax=Anaerobacillus alkalilacustris TaxID=393763 RepID=A0A1S2M0F8_9BACI|nr:glycerate kinase [Anaerobacillus alkalilacustris]OIJ17205.1 glycerate kinase [Anaerobacillus alkalilacustris]
MKVIIAPDSFKGSITSIEATKAISNALKELDDQIKVIELPMADGGEGTVDSILLSTRGEKNYCQVEDPLGRNIETYYGWIENQKMAIVETASASGLPLLKNEELNPLLASSFGTGQLINDALDKGAETIILGLGGSATVDCGVGLFQALGLKAFDQHEDEIHRVGGQLQSIFRLDTSLLDPRLQRVKIIIASDVTNPLLGKDGAIYVFGSQKGVKEEQFGTFEKGMRHFSKIVNKVTNKNMAEANGSGAAGGIGFLLQSLCDVQFRSGLELIVEINQFKKHLQDTDLVITGEGKIDGQSLFGKVPVGIARLARPLNIPVIAFAGTVGEDIEKIEQEGITTVIPIVNKPMSLEAAINNGQQLLFEAAKRVGKLILIGKTI